MNVKMTIPALLLAALVAGSYFLPAAMAEDVRTIQQTARASFAEAAPTIPGYNAPYPFAAAAQATTASPASYATIASGSFSATAPAIPGYNAAYPSLTVVVTQD